MAVFDDIVMLAIAIAVAAVVLVGLMLALYAWALRRSRQMDESLAMEEQVEYPPEARYRIKP
jgi:heme/copper-type cytochrome/quinol oxidase subunit 2